MKRIVIQEAEQTQEEQDQISKEFKIEGDDLIFLEFSLKEKYVACEYGGTPVVIGEGGLLPEIHSQEEMIKQ